MTRILLPILTLTVFLPSCETQRTVLGTESRMSFGKQWSGQVGDVDGLRDKFASGFEIRDGRAVAAGESQKRSSRRDNKTRTFHLNGEEVDLPKSNVKKIRTGPLANVRSHQDEPEVERFSGLKNFETETLNRNSFDAGDSPADSQKVAPWANRKSDLSATFETGRFADSGRTVATESNPDAGKTYATESSREAGKRFDFLGRRNQEKTESYEQRTAKHANARVTITDPLHPGDSMTVDEVRELLNPGQSANR